MRTLEYDRIGDEGLAIETVDGPTWAEVERRLDALDGNRHTVVWLHDGMNRLVVIGSKHGRCAVDLHGEDGSYSYLVDGDSVEDVPIAVADDEATIPRRRLVSLDLAREAARSFFNGRHPRGTWEGRDVTNTSPGATNN